MNDLNVVFYNNVWLKVVGSITDPIWDSLNKSITTTFSDNQHIYIPVRNSVQNSVGVSIDNSIRGPIRAYINEYIEKLNK